MSLDALDDRRVLNALLPFDDSGLAPNGLEAVCALPDLSVFNVRSYGAVGDGRTDDTRAIRAAMAAAVAAGGGIIYLPEGDYAVARQSEDGAGNGAIFSITSSNLVFLGDGPDQTLLSGYMPGIKDPVTTYDKLGNGYSKVGRFGMFRVDSSKAKTPISNVQFRSLEIDGNAGYTGNFTVGGVPATGDGWDMTHKAIALDGSKRIDQVLVFNCDVENWRGEMVYSGGNLIGKVSVVNSELTGSNASAVSCSGDVLVSHTRIGGSTPGSDVYNGVENFSLGGAQKTVIQDSTISCSSDLTRLHGNGIVYLGLPTSQLRVERTSVQRNRYGILFSEMGYHVTVKDSAFADNTHAMITSVLGTYPQYKQYKGFSDFSILNNTFDRTGRSFLNQWSGTFNDLVFRHNTVTDGALLGGTFTGPANMLWSGFVVDHTTLGVGAKDVSSYKGNNFAAWTNTVRSNPTANGTIGVQVNDTSANTTTKIIPLTDSIFLKGNKNKGDQYVVIDPTVFGRYVAGFQTTLTAARFNWVLRADPAWNTFPADVRVGAGGVTIRVNYQGLFELVSPLPNQSLVASAPEQMPQSSALLTGGDGLASDSAHEPDAAPETPEPLPPESSGGVDPTPAADAQTEYLEPIVPALPEPSLTQGELEDTSVALPVPTTVDPVLESGRESHIPGLPTAPAASKPPIIIERTRKPDEAPQPEDVTPSGLPVPSTSPTVVLVPMPEDKPATSGFAVSMDAGGGGVRLFHTEGGVTLGRDFIPFEGFTGGVRTATADFNGDGYADILAGTGPGIAARIQLLDGRTGRSLFTTNVFEGFTGGIFVAAGDFTGDGRPELVVTPDQGGGSRVSFLDGQTFRELGSFYGIDDPSFRGGARVAVGDLNGDGQADLVISAGFGGGPRVAVFDGTTLASGHPVKLCPDFFALEQSLRNGVYVTVGDLNADGLGDLVVGAGPGGGPRVVAFSGRDLLAGRGEQSELLANFFAGDVENRNGVRVAAKDWDGDLAADLITGAGQSGHEQIAAYLGSSLTRDGVPEEIEGLEGFADFSGGVFVG